MVKKKETVDSVLLNEETFMFDEPSSEPRKMTLYQAYRRKAFCPDNDEENFRIYSKKRRGYEGKEKTVVINIDD